MAPSRKIRLFGTEQPVEPPVMLAAGQLTAELDSGGLRYIRFGGREVLRSIAFLVRDPNWGTYTAQISDLEINQDGESFAVSYHAECRDLEQAFRYTARIEGNAGGSLGFEAEGEGLTDFLTSRTGFTVLHALAGVVGAPLTVEHTDGSVVESRFPTEVDPQCPFQDIRALTHEIAPGVSAVCRMEGDTFEMEDHRNWMDASYKTYVRPLALPWPYTIGKGEKTRQRVTLAIESTGDAATTSAGAGEVEVRIGDVLPHRLPRLALAVPAEHAAAGIERADLLARLGPAFLVCHFDARKGHNADTMRLHRQIGEAVGAELVLEAVLPCVDEAGAPTGDLDVLYRDIGFVADAAKEAGASFSTVAVAPSSDLKCTLPGSVFPPAPSWADMMRAAREAFPGAKVGGGMFSYFTELNRKRPPADALDFICHSGCPIVHAGDDVSMTETLEALPSQFHSTRVFAKGLPYWIFPTTVSMRDNPYGAAPMENPDNIRQAMNRVDPRERGLIGTAWYTGYLAHAARAGIDVVTLAAVAGPSGVVYNRQEHAQPWFDDSGGPILPLFHVLSGYGKLEGKLLATEISDARSVQALAVSNLDDEMRMILCNLTGEEVSVSILGLPGPMQVVVLDADSFPDACADAEWPSKAPRSAVLDGKLKLGPYAMAGLWAPPA